MAKKNPLYKKNGRYYADLRGYSDVGGGQEAMVVYDHRHSAPDWPAPSEGLGLLIEDIDFDRKRIRVRRNRFLRLKTKKSRRVIPLWPQLEEILRAYLAARGNPTKGVLFPSPKKPGKPVRTIKRLVKELELRIEYDGDLTPKVSRELGHKDTSMVEDVYGHVGPGIAGAPRKEHVEFLLEEFEDALGDRGDAVGSGRHE